MRGTTDRLDILINNAGIGSAGAARQTSADGHELRFAVNYLAGFLLTYLLLPLIKQSAPARIVNVASAGQQAIDFADVMLTRGYSGSRAYCQRKLAPILFTIDLALTSDYETMFNALIGVDAGDFDRIRSVTAANGVEFLDPPSMP